MHYVPMGKIGPADVTLERDRHFRIVENLIIIVAGISALLGAQGYSRGDAANSRLATAYSLVKFGTWYIDRPSDQEPIVFEQRTIDKVVLDGRILSSKPPILPLLMAREASLLHAILGWDMDDEEDLNKIVRVMVMSLIGFAYILAVIFFAKTLRLFVPDPLTRTVLIFCLSFCTQLWGFSTLVNNHLPAAAMVMAALYFALGLGTRKLDPAPWRFLAFGFAGGLVPTLDMPATIFIVLAGLYLLAKFPMRTICWVTPAAAFPLGVHCAIMYQTTGSILPVQVRPELYLAEGSYWRNPRGIDALNESKGVYLFHMTLGRCGIFSLYPILIGGLAATIRALYKKTVPYRGHILVGALGFIILTAYYGLETNNYGGEAYGFRWYIAAMPVLLLMAAPILMAMRVRWKWLFMGAMIGISFYSASQCMKSPWGANHEWTCKLFLGPTYGPLPDRHR